MERLKIASEIDVSVAMHVAAATRRTLGRSRNQYKDRRNTAGHVIAEPNQAI